ncbi:MAG: ATP-binding protein, partial [bacterium]|nr:ATP-binding protein [bacterium]
MTGDFGNLLIGAAGNFLYDITKRCFLMFFGTEYEEDPVINDAYGAVQRACQRFVNQYGEQFGPIHDSFLKREENIDILIKRVWFGNHGLKPDDLNPEGFHGSPRGTTESLVFLIEAFEEELNNNRQLSDRLAEMSHYQLLEKTAKDVENLQDTIGTLQTPPLPDKPLQLLTPLPPHKLDLIGRKRDLNALERKLKQKKRVLLVNGLGGIGKTEVCKAFFYKHYQHYHHAAWVDVVSSIKESMVQAFDSQSSGLFRASDTDTMDERFRKLMQGLNGLHPHSLIVLDNIEKVDDPELDKILALPMDVITSSRLNLEGFDAQTLDFLSEAQSRKLFYRYYRGDKDNLHVNKIIYLCNRHTLTVELLARTLQNATKSMKWLYDILKKKGFNLNEVVGDKVHTFWHDEAERKRFFDHLLTIFELSGVTEEEEQILTNLSVLPAIYIPIDTLNEWLALETNEAITGLVFKGWLRQEKLEVWMHPVVQEVIRYKTSPNAAKCRWLIISLVNKLGVKPGENPVDKETYIIFSETLLQHIAGNSYELAALINNLSVTYMQLGQT